MYINQMFWIFTNVWLYFPPFRCGAAETLPVLSIEENCPGYEEIRLLFSAFPKMRGITTIDTTEHRAYGVRSRLCRQGGNNDDEAVG